MTHPAQEALRSIEEAAMPDTTTTPRVLETFDYEGVRHLASRFRSQVERAREVYGLR